MKLNLKYNATKVDEIEQATRRPINDAIDDGTMNNLALFIQKGLIDDNGHHGVSRSVAMDTIDKYLEENDRDELILAIMEALVAGGFLSRQLDVEKMRQANRKRNQNINDQLEKVIKNK